MKLEELPFKIGMQYENWEFDLELIEVKKSYEVYLYNKRDVNFIKGEKVKYTHLYFELDVLFKIKIKTLRRTIIID